MTGPEHYREAERLLLEVLPAANRPDEVVARAQVHATLALAAATALNPAATRSDVLHDSWWAVAS